MEHRLLLPIDEHDEGHYLYSGSVMPVHQTSVMTKKRKLRDDSSALAKQWEPVFFAVLAPTVAIEQGTTLQLTKRSG